MLYLLRCAESWWYDQANGVSTRRRIPVSKLDLTGEVARFTALVVQNRATLTACERCCALWTLNMRNTTSWIWVAGKGRSLLVAAEFPFHKILGSELSQTLSDLARQNCKTFRSKIQACKEVEIIRGDSAEFEFPDAPLVIYLFNPFGARILFTDRRSSGDVVGGPVRGMYSSCTIIRCMGKSSKAPQSSIFMHGASTTGTTGSWSIRFSAPRRPPLAVRLNRRVDAMKSPGRRMLATDICPPVNTARAFRAQAEAGKHPAANLNPDDKKPQPAVL